MREFDGPPLLEEVSKLLESYLRAILNSDS